MIKFKYRKVAVAPSQAFPKRKYVPRPIIPLSIIIGGKRLRYEALIDSGADYTIFPAALGLLAGLNIKEGKKESIMGVSGSTMTVYFHHILVNVGGYEIKVYSGFAEAMNQDPGILGQSGFFNKFQVSFDLKKKEVEIKLK